MFEYDDIAHSGHLLMKQVELVPSKKGKKAKKKEEWTLEYFILLHSKHLVHFQPNTGFVDPFKKTISGKAIDLMQASVAMDDEPTEGSSELQAFRIKTSRIEYHLKPQDEVGGNAEDWVEEITEVMLAAEEGDDDDADRDYGAFMGDYNEVVPRERGVEAAAVRAAAARVGQGSCRCDYHKAVCARRDAWTNGWLLQTMIPER